MLAVEVSVEFYVLKLVKQHNLPVFPSERECAMCMHRYLFPGAVVNASIPYGIEIFQNSSRKHVLHKNNVTAANDEHLSFRETMSNAMLPQQSLIYLY